MDIACGNACAGPMTEVLVRDILCRLADRWMLLTIEALAGGEMRFTPLRQRPPRTIDQHAASLPGEIA